MGNCIGNSGQIIARKREGTKSYQEKKFKVCNDGDGVVRVKVLVTRKELEKLMKHCNNNRRRIGSMEGILDAEMLIKSMTDAEMLKDGIGDWKPNLESIPEEVAELAGDLM